MSKQNQNTSLPAGDEKKSSAAKRQRIIVIICAGAIILTMLFISIRNLVNGYYESFVLHGESLSSAMTYIDPLQYDDTEQALLAPLQTKWDLYRAARLEERVSVTAGDGISLSGLLYDEGSDVTVIALHGLFGSAEGDFLYGPFYGETLGANLLLPDSRGLGESGGNSISYGYRESDDLLDWIDWVIDRYGSKQKIVIHGDTMGAATALMAASRLPENVVLIVAESPYASLEETATYELKSWFGMPAPFFTLLQWRNDAGFQADDVIVTNAVADAAVPALFLLGTADSYIPPDMTRAVYEAYGGAKELAEVEAEHGLLYAADSSAIEKAITQLWNEFLF